MHRWGGWAALTALAAICAAPNAGAILSAQAARQEPPDSAEPKVPRLFAEAEPLALTLTADFGAIGKQRGTEKKDQPGVLSYAPLTGDSVRLDVKLHTRGHFRLKICQYPPLKVVFDK